MATKHGRMVAHLDVLLPIKSHDPLITRSCDITWQAKTIKISSLSQCLWPQNVVGWWLILKGSYNKAHNALIMWSGKFTWQTKIIISLLPECLWPPNMVEWWHTLRESYYKVILRFDHEVMHGHVKSKNHYIRTTRVPMTKNLEEWYLTLMSSYL